MELFLVHPNLSVSHCDSAPTDATIDGKKQDYMKNLEKYHRMIQRLASDPSVRDLPSWCLTRDTESNVMGILKNNTVDALESPSASPVSGPEQDSSVLSTDLPLPAPHHERKKSNYTIQIESIDNVEDLPLESIEITDSELVEFKGGDRPVTEHLLLDRLNMPPNASSDLLGIKLLQLNTDISLVEFKYIQVYSQINQTIKKYFAAPELTPEMEEEGYTAVDRQMSFFRKLEFLLIRLRRILEEFLDCYGDKLN